MVHAVYSRSKLTADLFLNLPEMRSQSMSNRLRIYLRVNLKNEFQSTQFNRIIWYTEYFFGRYQQMRTCTDSASAPYEIQKTSVAKIVRVFRSIIFTEPAEILIIIFKYVNELRTAERTNCDLLTCATVVSSILWS